MSLPRKGSRTLTHGAHRYRWYVRKQPTYSQAAFQSSMTVAIERICEVPGTVLLVDLRVSRPDNWISRHQTALMPAIIRQIITSALDDGWNPEVPGSAWNFEHGLIRDKA